MRKAIMRTLIALGLLVTPTVASASYEVCVPIKASATIKTPAAGGKCPAENNKAWIPDENEKEILAHMKYVAEGVVTKKPTIEISGVNVQLKSGAAKDKEVNGEGNLILGNDEGALSTQTGSDNIALGSDPTFTGWDGIVSGATNAIEGESAAAIAGSNNVAISGGATVGGSQDFAQLLGVAVGGTTAEATGARAVVVGGNANRATAEGSIVLGGGGNKAVELRSSVFGGTENEASGKGASVAGGSKLKATKENEPIL